ncbi:MAG: DUF192 domain-containing protein [Robiginitomaculum sp.]|nr:DUF192 domain-containing protein [Robiginitomaculum sp.]
MKNFVLIVIIAFGLACSSFVALAQSPQDKVDFGPKETLSVVSNDKTHTFTIEVADTPTELAYGMMFRDEIAPDEGMLLEFGEERIASIWMKNTSVFLDVIFVRADGRILKIEHSAKPYSLRSMTSEALVTGVLEIAGGQAHALGIQPGDKVQHSYFSTAPE